MTFTRSLWTFIAGAGTLVTGFVAGFRLLRPPAVERVPIGIRQSSYQASEYQHINPLLAVNIPQSAWFTKLQRDLRHAIDNARIENKATAVSVYFKDLFSSQWFVENNDEIYNPASMMKVLTMIATLKRAEMDDSVLTTEITYDGQVDLNEKEHLRSPVEMPAGTYTVESLLGHMIKHSNNNAAALLNDYLNESDVSLLNQPYLDLGIEVADVNDDYLNIERYALVWRVLYNATYLSRAMSEHALNLLAQSDFNRALVQGIPASVPISHKYGEFGIVDQDGRIVKAELHECGIIYDEQAPYLLCVMTKGDDLEQLASVVAQMSAITYGSEERRSGAF